MDGGGGATLKTLGSGLDPLRAPAFATSSTRVLPHFVPMGVGKTPPGRAPGQWTMYSPGIAGHLTGAAYWS
jgi:hypothetical protein